VVEEVNIVVKKTSTENYGKISKNGKKEAPSKEVVFAVD